MLDEDEVRAAARAHHALLAAEIGRRSTTSRVLHQLDAASASATAAVIAAIASCGFLLSALFAPHASTWLSVFEALAAAVTLVMVFALQHTQARQQAAVQRKLDEILRVLPGSDPRAMHIETATEAELIAFDERHAYLRNRAIEESDSR